MAFNPWSTTFIKRGVRKSVFENGLAKQLPEAYRKFWKEWKQSARAPVHYVREEGRWKKNEVTGEIIPVQNVPILTKYPKESHWGLWGGEGVVKGFTKKKLNKRRVPHYWVPIFSRSVVYSEILNVYLSTIITDRTLMLIHEHYGFDHYILKTPACDLKSKLAIKIKREMLLNLLDNCPAYVEDPERQKEVYETYKEYLAAYTPEEVEWYGLSFSQALQKLSIQNIVSAEASKKPLKVILRADLIEKLKETQISDESEINKSSWISKINPFGKKEV